MHLLTSSKAISKSRFTCFDTLTISKIDTVVSHVDPLVLVLHRSCKHYEIDETKTSNKYYIHLRAPLSHQHLQINQKQN